jgi:hypothetical protein
MSAETLQMVGWTVVFLLVYGALLGGVVWWMTH